MALGVHLLHPRATETYKKFLYEVQFELAISILNTHRLMIFVDERFKFFELALTLLV